MLVSITDPAHVWWSDSDFSSRIAEHRHRGGMARWDRCSCMSWMALTEPWNDGGFGQADRSVLGLELYNISSNARLTDSYGQGVILNDD